MMILETRRLLSVLMILLCAFSTYGQIDAIHEKYYYPDSVASKLSGYSLYNRLDLVNKLVEPFDNEELKFRAVFTWICLNIENDYSAYLKNDVKRRKLKNQPDRLNTWNEEYRQKVLKTLLSKNKTVCSGYSYLLKEMATIAGIECVVIDGYGRDAYVNIKGERIPNHSWNAAKLNGQWYLFDATWASGMYEENIHRFVPYFDDVYFMTSADLFALNHYPLDATWTLLDNQPRLEDFLEAPIIYRPALANGIIPVTPNKFSCSIKRGSSLDFVFQSKNEIDTQAITLRLVNSEGMKIVPSNVVEGNEDQFYLECAFENRGLQVIHLYMNEDPLMTYEVRVIK